MHDPRSDIDAPLSRARRRALLGAALAATAAQAFAVLPARAAQSSGPHVEVWKNPSCGCCGDWIRHLERDGFSVTVRDTGNTTMRERLGIPAALGSCHTARIGAYAFEGHVPAREIRRLLKEQPVAVGLAVPGMPIGSPGMDGPEYGGRKDPYAVLLVLRDGQTRTYQTYR